MRIVIEDLGVGRAIRKGGKAHSKTKTRLRDVYSGRYEVFASVDIFEEYQEVLSRPHLKVNWFARWRWLLWVKRNATFIEPLPTSQEQVEMKDEDDRIFFDVAKCVKARLITRNLKHYPIDELRTSIDEFY